jgi:gamma-glutamylcyclotransferase (GGCT)/AIG2-like uncharacterized protein YtfP
VSGARVFVYGTLLRGCHNNRLLTGAAFEGEAMLLGYALHDLGGCPAILPDPSRSVTGEVFAVDAPTLALLDRLEGHPLIYARSAVTLADGSAAEAYVGAAPWMREAPRIPGGSWRRRREGPGRPPGGP